MNPLVDLSSLLTTQAGRLGNRTCVRTAHDTVSWRELDDLTAHMAAGLVELGLGERSLVMSIGGNDIPQLLTWFACQRIGAVYGPLNPLLSGAPLSRILAHVQPAAVVTGPNHGGVMAEAIAGLDDPPLVLDSDRVERMLSGPTSVLSRPDLDSDGWAKVMFTSGTTGEPKAAVWSRRCEAIWAAAYASELLDVQEGEGIYTCLPLAHVTCQGTVMSALQRGAVLTLAERFEPFSYWDQIREAQARRFTFVGTILATLAKLKPRANDRDHPVDHIVGAGAPIAQWRAIEERFGVTIIETYGQTETAGCYTKPTSLPQRPGSIGRPTSRFEVRLRASSAGREGELLIRPHSSGAIFEGYLRADGSVETPYDEDGWYHTGDLARTGSDGDLEFVVRERESIRRRGEIIASVPIEEAAVDHPDVTEAAAIAVPADDGVDEEIKLIVVPAAGCAIEPRAVHAHLRAVLPRFMVPRYIAVADALPKTASTRVQKFRLDRSVDGCFDARRRSEGRAHKPR